jgi:hypothetical protein
MSAPQPSAPGGKPALDQLASVARGLVSGLKSLHLISFALLLGAGMVVTAFAIWFGMTLSYGDWPEAVAAERIRVLGAALLLSLGLIGLVMVTLGVGGRLKIDKVSINTVAGGGEIDFAEDGAKPAPAAPEDPPY